MKYLHLALWSPRKSAGGFETVLNTTAKAQVKKGHSVFIVGRIEGKKQIKITTIDGVTYIEIARPIKRCPSTLQIGFLGITKLILEILYSYLLLTPIVLKLIRDQKIDAVVFYGIHLFLASPLFRMFGATTILGIEGIQKNPHPSKLSITYWFRKYKYHFFTGVFTINELFYLPDGTIINNFALLQKYAGKKKTFFFPWGVNLAEIKKVKEDNEFAKLKKIKKIKIIICPRRLVEEKGVRYLVYAIPEVIKEYPQTHFIFTSDGVLRNELENLTKKLHIYKYVTFTGPLPYSRVLSIMKTTDAMVAPSSGEELFGMVFLEAYALQVPIISTWFGGIPNVVHDKKTGILVPPKDTRKLARAIITILSQPKLAKNFIKNGEALVKKEYQLDQTLENLDNCVRALTKHGYTL